MTRRLGTVLLLTLFLFIVGCADPGEKTQVGAATGGVIGAGLGAIVGNQTGDPGSGLVVGALAGAGTGAAIGNVLDEQDETIAYQSETIERQGRQLQAQKAELEELRRMGQDQVSFKNDFRSRFPKSQQNQFGTINQPKQTQDNFAYNQQPRWPTRTPKVTESTVVNPAPYIKQQTPNTMNTAQQQINNTMNTSRGAYRWGKEQTNLGTTGTMDTTVDTNIQASNTASSFTSAECKEAEAEIQKAQGAIQTADQLFHYRRALRLCPNNPAYHNGLGEIYLSLSRREDAKYEFEKALEVDPTYQAAKDNIALLRR